MNIRIQLIILILILPAAFPLSAREINVDSLFKTASDLTLSAAEKKKRYEKLGEQLKKDHNVGTAADAYSLAIKFARDAGLVQDIPELLLEYASMSTYAGRYSSAITALEETIDLLKGNPNDTIAGRTYMQMGIIFFFQEKWDDALTFYQRALEIAQTMKNETGISIAYNNIANIYQKKKDFESACSYYEKALKIERANADSASMCNSLMNIGTIMIDQNKIEESFKPLIEALEIASKTKNVEIQALCHAHLAYYYAYHSLYGKANELLTIAENLAQQTGYDQVRLCILDLASFLYADHGLYSLAYECLKRSNALSDSIASRQMKEKVSEFEVRFKSKEKESEIALKNQELKLVRRLQFAFILICILMTCIISILFILIRRRHKQNKRLREMNDTKDRLLSIISHDIKGPVIAQKMALDAMLTPQSDYDAPTRSMLSSIRDSVVSELILLQNLLDWANIQLSNLVTTFVNFNIVENIEKAISLHSISAHNKGIELQLDAPQRCIVRADLQMINTVVRNLLSNAIKFSKGGHMILIRVEERKTQGGVKISISDQGIGMSQKQINDILESDKNNKITVGTNGEKGSGLGLIICKGLLERNKSKLCIDSKQGKGSIFSFVLTSP